jgi:hypothetical protein
MAGVHRQGHGIRAQEPGAQPLIPVSSNALEGKASHYNKIFFASVQAKTT